MRQGYWDDTDIQTFRALRGRRTADAVVVGGGLSGISVALWLLRAGLRVTLLEADRVGGGATSRCAGMMSLMSGLRYARLEKRAGATAAASYAQTQQSALAAIRELCRAEGFDSGLQDADAQLVTGEADGERYLGEEAEAMRRAGISPSLIKPTQCPMPVESALLLRDMATLDPMRYLASMVKSALSLGLKLYDGSRVTAIETNLAYTERGSVLAPYIVIATGYPIVNVPGRYFLKLMQRRSALVPMGFAGFDGMYIDMRGGYALRRVRDGSLLQLNTRLSGDVRSIGERELFAARYSQYFDGEYPRDMFGGFETFSPDGLPYIGAYSKKTPNLFVASGYNGSGLIGSMVAAQAISASILGLNMESYSVYSGFRKGGADGVRTAAHIGGRYLASRLRFKAPRCPHMGCKLSYNRAARIWECPCHGSRFDDIGHVLCAPAVKDAEIGRR